MRYREIIERMKNDGHYSQAIELECSLERGRGSTHDPVYSRHDARDGLSFFSYAGNCAERAYENIKHDAWRQQEREMQEQEDRRREERQRHEAMMERQRQEENEQWEAQRQQEQEFQESVEQGPTQDDPHDLEACKGGKE